MYKKFTTKTVIDQEKLIFKINSLDNLFI